MNRRLQDQRPSHSARVVNVTGGVPGRIDLDNLQTDRSFRGLDTYSHTKTIQMALSYEFAQRLQAAASPSTTAVPARPAPR